MSYILYGTQTSPYVRRLRMLMEHLSYEFKEISVFEAVDAEKLNQINPINQVPVLTHGDQTIWDSRQIFSYLNHMHKLQNMDWNDENQLTAIEGAMASGIALLLMKRSGIQVDEPLMYVQRQKERIESILDYLKPYIQSDALTEWNFHTMSLYSLLDWGSFRGIIDLESRPECQKFLTTHASRPIVIKTAIPKG